MKWFHKKSFFSQLMASLSASKNTFQEKSLTGLLCPLGQAGWLVNGDLFCPAPGVRIKIYSNSFARWIAFAILIVSSIACFFVICDL